MAEHIEVCEIVRLLCFSGDAQPNLERLGTLKNMCRDSESVVRTVYQQLSGHLKQAHAQVRLSCVQIAHVLFMRSALFRSLLTENFQEFLSLVVGLDDVNEPLPPPAQHAKILRQTALENIYEWHEKYGKKYKPLALGFTHLQRTCRVDFDQVMAGVRAAAQAQREAAEKAEAERQRQVIKAKYDLELCSGELSRILSEMEGIMRLLVPDLSDFSHLFADIERSGSTDREHKSDGEGVAAAAAAATAAVTHSQDVHDIEPSAADSAKGEETDEDIGHVVKENEGAGGGGDLGEADGSGDAGLLEQEERRRKTMQILGVSTQQYELEVSISRSRPMPLDAERQKELIDELQVLARVLLNKYKPTLDSALAVLTEAQDASAEAIEATVLDKHCSEVLNQYVQLHLPDPGLENACRNRGEDDEMMEDVTSPTRTSSQTREQAPTATPASKTTPATAHSSAKPAVMVMKKASSGTTATPSILMSLSSRDKDEMHEVKVGSTSFLVDRIQVNPNTFRRSSDSGDMDAATSQPPASSTATSTSTSTSTTSDEQSTSTMSDEQRKRMFELAPVVPYGTDLLYWGQEETASVPVAGMHRLHRFLGEGDSSDGISVSKIPQLTQRTEFVVKTDKAVPLRRCRAPIAGQQDDAGRPRLCARLSSATCPLHGRVVDRDDDGVPTNPADRARELAAIAEAQEAQEKEMERAKKGKGKRKAEVGDNLVDLKKIENTPRTRLWKKVRNTVVHSIDPVLDKLRKEKFSGNWVSD